MPPDLWRWKIAARPSLAEIDGLPYETVYRGIVLEGIYEMTRSWHEKGSSDKNALKGYYQLKRMGLVD